MSWLTPLHSIRGGNTQEMDQPMSTLHTDRESRQLRLLQLKIAVQAADENFCLDGYDDSLRNALLCLTIRLVVTYYLNQL